MSANGTSEMSPPGIASKAEMTENNIVSVFAYDAGRQLVYCNHSARLLCGIDDIVEIRQSGFPRVRPRGCVSPMPLCDLKGRGGFSDEVVIEVKPTKFIPCLVNRNVCQDDDSSTPLSVFYVLDITENYAYRAQLEESNRQLMDANQAKQEFLAHMSHELRTPLNAIIGFSEVMEKEIYGSLGNARYKDYASDILESGTYLLSLINDLLDLSRIEAEKFEIFEEELEVSLLVESCLRMISAEADKYGVFVESTMTKELPALMADDRLIRQALLNVLSNAVKFTPSGGRVTITNVVDARRCISIEVKDTGVGIDEQDLAKVMTAFGQINATERHDRQGSGLGLPLAKRFVELHGGTLTLVSQLGVGTTVTMAFPWERTIEVCETAVVMSG
jgi:nitrogen-specific signal transduction histidine kinase